MGMFGSEGEWSLRSVKDPRWNCSGRGFISMGSRPEEADAKIEEMEEKFGEMPDDLTYSCIKD